MQISSSRYGLLFIRSELAAALIGEGSGQVADYAYIAGAVRGALACCLRPRRALEIVVGLTSITFRRQRSLAAAARSLCISSAPADRPAQHKRSADDG